MESNNKYSRISVEELLHDDNFISSVLSPTAASRVFWEKMLADGDIDPVCYAQARNFLLSLNRFSCQYGVRQERLNIVRERIERSIALSKPQIARPRKTHRPVAWLWPVAITISAACIAAALLLTPALTPRKGEVMTIGGTPVSATGSEPSDIIVLSLEDKNVRIEGYEAHLDYSEGLKINEKTIEDRASSKGDLNMLSVPFGKRSSITLSDGSRLWLNAGTKVVYPNEFVGGSREIYVNGEIYGEIAHDPSRPFIVKTTEAEVSVLGTTLNINAYEANEGITVVLVEGRVEVTNRNGGTAVLAPSQMYYGSEGQYQIRNVEVENHISWKDGVYKFQNEKMENIIKQLGRYYNVRIEASDAVKEYTCSGELIIRDELPKVLEGVCKTARIVYRWDAVKETYYLEH